MIRAFILCLCLALTARASEPINVPYEGATAPVKQPHVTAELIPQVSTIEPGKPFGVILHLHMDKDWHTYWINPGDAGLATTIKWTLPEGFSAGSIQWPTPEKHNMGPLVTYGYEGDAYLITTLTPPADMAKLPKHVDIKAKAAWLVCKEECIPGKADLALTLDTGSLNLRLPIDNSDFFKAAEQRLPVANKGWDVKGAYGTPPELGGMAKEALEIMFSNKAGSPEKNLGHLEFFPEQPNVLDALAKQALSPLLPNSPEFNLWITLQQNGEKPDQISGVLVSDVPLVSEKTGDSHAVYIAPFSTKNAPNEIPTMSSSGGPDNSLSGSPQATGGSQATTAPSTSTPPPMGTSAATSAQPFLLVVLGAAFIGGLILNLMPCVLPVLSLKVFSLIKHGENPHLAWRQGAAFTAGVVLSFWLLAGVLLALRSAGNHLGWGFQMQSPGFVLALIFIFFLLALNLFGVFELGTSLVGLDAKVTGKTHGLLSSFLNGALATLAATPCTAPFMGSSLGFAAQQPAYIALLIFTFLALGMAAPYLLLTIFPGALKFVPKPGAWMEAFKQFMGFLLMGTVIFLVYVFGALTSQDQIYGLLGTLLFFSVLAWAYGRWGQTILWIRYTVLAIAIIYLAATWELIAMPAPTTDKTNKSATQENGWQVWSEDAVQKELAAGHPVFVDFTAAWCLSCKVNEKVALDASSVKEGFAKKGVVLFKGDWTHSDPAISKALQKYNRDGVPLYLLYSPKDPANPQVLPEVLTPGIVLDALNRL